MGLVKIKGPTLVEIIEYRKQAHKTRKHARPTFLILNKLWKKSRRNDEDVWDELTNYAHPTESEHINGSAIKGAFRAFLLKRQQGRCCYCRCWLLAAAQARHIEHILPRSSYRRFSLDFLNLTVACVDCNLAKSRRVWGNVPLDALVYPSQNFFADMYHPRFHHYNEHVRYIAIETNDGAISIYLGLTPQGRHLCLNLLDKIASKRALLNNNLELKDSMSEIEGYRNVVEKIGTPALDIFSEALNDRLTELING